MARPSEFEPAIADRICELLAEGRFLKDICAREEMPAVSTVLRWRADNPEFERLYQFALEAFGQVLMQQALDIADDDSGDDPEQAKGGGRRASYVAIERAKLRIETRFRMIRRMTSRRRAVAREPDWSGVAPDIPSGPGEVEWLPAAE